MDKLLLIQTKKGRQKAGLSTLTMEMLSLERFPDQCTGWLLTADCQIRRWIWQSSGSMPYMQLEFALTQLVL